MAGRKRAARTADPCLPRRGTTATPTRRCGSTGGGDLQHRRRSDCGRPAVHRGQRRGRGGATDLRAAAGKQGIPKSGKIKMKPVETGPIWNDSIPMPACRPREGIIFCSFLEQLAPSRAVGVLSASYRELRHAQTYRPRSLSELCRGRRLRPNRADATDSTVARSSGAGGRTCRAHDVDR